MGFKFADTTPTKTWNNPEYEKLYNSAIAQGTQRSAEAKFRASDRGMLTQTALNVPQTMYGGAKAVGKILGGGVTRAGISGYEAIGDISTGLRSQGVGLAAAVRNGGSMRDRQKAGMDAYYKGLERLKGFDERKYYNTPFGKLGSVQKEAQVRADRIIEGEDKLYTALNPMIDTILDVSDVTLVGAFPSMAKKFGKHLTSKTSKLASKELDKGVEAVAKGGDINVYIKNQQAKDYITQNKNLGEDELRSMLLKDWTVDNVETGLRTPLTTNNKSFVAGVVDDSIAKNGFDVTYKNLAEVQSGIVKQLDNVTTQPRMNREALAEALEQSDEIAQQKAIASHQLNQPAKTPIKAFEKKVAKQGGMRKQQSSPIAKPAALPKSKRVKKSTITKSTGVVKKEAVVKTTERKLLRSKLRAQEKNLKVGKKIGKAEQKTLFSTVTQYAKASGLPKSAIGKLLTQKRISNVSTKKQLNNIIKAIDAKVGVSVKKIAGQAKLDAMAKEVHNISKISKRYDKGTGTRKILNTLRSTANKAKDPILKKQAIDQLKAATKTALKAETYSKNVYKKLHLVESNIGKTNMHELRKRLGIPSRNQMFSASLYGGKNFDKELALLEKAAKHFVKGDTLIPKKAAWGLEQAGIKGASVLPKRMLVEQDKVSGLLGSSWFKTVTESAAPRFASPQRMKTKSELIGEFITNAQKAEVLSDSRVAGFKIFFEDSKKTFNKIPKKERPTSNSMIQSLTEGAQVSGNEIEEKIAKSFRDLLNKNAKYLEDTDGSFVRRDGYFPDNEVYDKSMRALVRRHGMEDGLTAFFKANKSADANHAMAAIHNGMRSDTANFLKTRKGKGRKSTDVFASMMKYQSEFEKLRLIREASPHIAAMKMLGDAVSEETAWVAQYAAMLEKSLTAPSDTKVLDKLSSVMYVAKLGVSTPSALTNLAGGASVDFLSNGALATIKGSKRAMQNPVEMHRMLSANGMLGGNFIEQGTESLTSKYARKISDTLMIQQKAAENILRTKQLAGLMTDTEYKAFKAQGKKFKFTPERAVELLDNIERTQGHFTKLHTAPIFKTWYGKLALPFTRWMFNSADIMATATKDIATFPKHGDISRLKRASGTFARAAVLYYGGNKLMGYADANFADTTKTSKLQRKVGRTMKEASTGALGILPSMVESPVLEDMKMVVNSADMLLAEQGIKDYPFDYENLKTVGDIYMLGTTMNKFLDLKDESVKEMYGKYVSMNPSDRAIYKKDVLAENDAVGRDVSGTFQRYELYSKNNITKKEFDLSFIGDKDEKKKRVTQYIKSLPTDKQSETLSRLLKAKVIKREDVK